MRQSRGELPGVDPSGPFLQFAFSLALNEGAEVPTGYQLRDEIVNIVGPL